MQDDSITRISKYEVPQWTYEVAQLSAQLADAVAQNSGRVASDPPIVGLNMAYNILIHCYEILDHYYNIWTNMNPLDYSPTRISELLAENEQRISLVQKSALILVLSAFEASGRLGLTIPKSPVVLKSKKIYLLQIMKESKDLDLIDFQDYILWNFVTTLRNCMVHNNSVADLDLSHEFEGYIIELKSGQMIQSTPRKGLLLLKVVIEAFGRWSLAFCNAL